MTSDSLERLKLTHQREDALREARVLGMTAAIEHLVLNSPLPVNLAYVHRHLGLDGRGPEADAVSEAIVRMLASHDLRLAGDHTLSVHRARARRTNQQTGEV